MDTITREITRDEWRASFALLSERFQGWRVMIEVLSPDLGDQPVAEGPPLQGLSLETTGSEAGDILIEAGDSPDDYLVHHVDRPTNVRLAIIRAGVEAAIQFESEDGITTILHLRALPELPA